MTFKALLATNTGEKISASVVDVAEQDFMPGGVTVRIDYSTVNFKDAMALSGYVDVIKQFPLIAGIDFAGTPVRPHRSAHMGELNGQYLKAVDLARRLPNAEVVLYTDAGHGGIFQYHEAFVEKVRKFLEP